MKTRDKEKLMMDLLVYMRAFQQFDLEQKRELDEIVSIIHAIPHNRGFERNGIIFDGSFDNLLTYETVLNEKATRFAELNDDGGLKLISLNDFLILVLEDTK